MVGNAPDNWGGCYWVHRAETLLNAQAALSHHQAEKHRD